jgi:PAS domain S-box-containing protein
VNNESIKILLIDDDEEDFILTKELFALVKVGQYVIDWSSSYDEALAIVARREHDVCLVDYQLGDRSGVDLIREARESRLTTPMILLTGQGDYDVDVKAMNAGATDYLVKDETSPARLERTIRYAVQLNIERCRTEAELLDSANKLRVEREYFGHIISAAPTVIVGISIEGITTFVNQAIRTVAGYEPAELIGKQWWHVLYPGDEYRQVEKLFEDLEESGVIDYEMTLTTKSGEKRCVSWNSVNRVNEQSELVEIIGIGIDVTDRTRAEDALREQERIQEAHMQQSQKMEAVGHLAGGVAHDFNNLLTVIAGYSDLTLKRLDRADPLFRNVEEIKKAAERATSLTRQLLAFSRKQVLQPKILDLNTVIVNIQQMLGRLVGEDLELQTSLDEGLCYVKADPGQIEQVILNLVVNARDAMPDGGKITIETANVYLDEAYMLQHVAGQPGRFAMLAVTDTGSGIDVEIQKNIFEPFFTTKEQGKGTGLGLSTVYGIIKQSGGNILVYSEVGVGTTFKIYLPHVNEKVSKPDAEAERPKYITGTSTILLAEDEEMVRNLARESLTIHGFKVLEAANAGEALLICQHYEGPIHLLLTDVVMPRMGGSELARRLGELRPDTQVLYMSGYTDHAIVHHGILNGQIDFIGKPFTPDKLVLKVVEVLNRK